MSLPHLSTSLAHDAPPLNTDTEGVATTPAQGAVIPPAAVPWLTALVAAALITAKAAPVGSPVQVVADSLVDVAVLFGLASPGWRRK
jgi:hypothetical protein